MQLYNLSVAGLPPYKHYRSHLRQVVTALSIVHRRSKEPESERGEAECVLRLYPARHTFPLANAIASLTMSGGNRPASSLFGSVVWEV